MRECRIELEKIGSYSETLDNTDCKGTIDDLDDYFNDLIEGDERINKDDYILSLVENETDRVVYRIRYGEKEIF